MAGRTPQPWFWEEKQAWFVYLDGRRVRLGKDKDRALRRFHRLMAGRGEADAEADSTLTVEGLVTLYLADAEHRLKKNTLRVTSALLDNFASRYGNLRVRDVRKHHAEAWVRGNARWNPTTQSLAKTRLVTLFKWGVEQGFLAANPIAGIRKPPQRSRGTQTLVTAEQHGTLTAHAEACFRDVLVTLWETGARPGEVTSVTAADFNAERAVWVMRQHKNAHKGHSRIVYLTPAVVAICKRLAEKYPTGPLYRTQRGTPYGWCGLSKRMGWLRQRLGLPDTITVYGYRHSFATDALANGVPDAQVAELLGHSGTAMLHKHYSHLTARAKALRSALGQIR
jgi:integrase